jgi:hypothetical protein
VIRDMSQSDSGQVHSNKVWNDFKDWRNEPKPVLEKKPRLAKK